MIRFRLNDGSIVPAEKDCNCCIHEGPHWLHMDDIDRAINADMPMSTMHDIRAKAECESRRLEMKSHEMRMRGIVEIIRGPRKRSLPA